MLSTRINEKRNPITLLKQHETTINQLTNFKQIPNTAESLQTTMNLYLIVGAFITSNKPSMLFTGKDTEHSVADFLNANTANIILIIGPEPTKTHLHQNGRVDVQY